MSIKEIEALELAEWLAEQAELDAQPIAKGYCWMCEGYTCRCEEFKLLD